MHCDEAARMLHAGESSPELDLHLSACDGCRALAADLSELRGAFARARGAWKPSAAFRVRLPAAPWRRLAIAASLLVAPFAVWAVAELAPPPAPADLSVILDPRQDAPLSDRETLGMLFLERRGQP